MKIFGFEIVKSKELKTPLAWGRNFSFDPQRDLSGFKLNFEVLFQLYRSQSDITNCVREWSENIGAGGIELYNPQDEEKEVPENIQEEIFEILNYKEIWRLKKIHTIDHLGIAGNAYWLIVRNVFGDVIGIDVLDPRSMYLVTDKYGHVHKYFQKIGVHETIEYEPEEIIHFKFSVDPTHEVFGFAPTESIIWEGRTDIEAMISNFFFFKNNAQPSVQYIVDDNLSDEEEEKLIKEIKAQLKGSTNRGRGGVFKGIKEIKTIGTTHKDMEFLSGRRFTTRKICARFGVPEFLLGYTEAVNNNNGVELTKNTYLGTFLPKEKIFEEQITKGLLNRIGLEGQVALQFKPQVFDIEAIEKRALSELDRGVITRRQYKVKTGQDITPQDEADPNFDLHIVHQGKSSTLLSQVGTLPEQNNLPK